MQGTKCGDKKARAPEKRPLYILNIIVENKARRADMQKNPLVEKNSYGNHAKKEADVYKSRIPKS